MNPKSVIRIALFVVYSYLIGYKAFEFDFSNDRH